MAHAYTPGLRVARKSRLTRERVLPLKGELLVKVGDAVRAEDVIAKSELPGPVTVLNVINQLGIEPEEIREYMLKKEGDTFKKGEPIAENKPILGLSFLKTQVKAPIDGVVESISEITGQVVLREPPQPVQIHAYIDGRVIKVMPDEGAVVETVATFVQGIFGVGGEAWGELEVVVKTPHDILTPEMIKESHSGKILLAGKHLSRNSFERAREVGVKGVIVGGFHDKDLKEILGYDLGVAITGAEKIGLTLILTEGFGEIPVAERTFNLLKERSGMRASISGATQIRAGVIRPEIIIPYPEEEWEGAREVENVSAQAVAEGDPVRVIREPYFGMLGTVKRLIPGLEVVESGSKVRVLEVQFEHGTSAIVPRANIERIEE